MTASAGATDDTRIGAVAKELIAFRGVLRGKGRVVLGGRVILLGGDEDAVTVARALFAIGVQELTFGSATPVVRAAATDLLGGRWPRAATVAEGADLLGHWQSAHGVVDARADAGELPLDRALLAPGAWVVRCRTAPAGSAPADAAPVLVTEA